MKQGKLEAVKQVMNIVKSVIVKSEHWHFRNQWTKMDWVNLTQMTIIFTTVGKTLLEEME